jgi:hypothetical protein
MSIYEDTKKSYYTILQKKLNEGNSQFSALIKTGCYSGNRSKGHQREHENFEKFVILQNKMLLVNGNIISIDESVFDNFPQKRPPTCVKQCTDVGEGNPCSWTRSWYWANKRGDYNRIKTEIDEKLKVLKIEDDKIKSVIEEKRILEIKRIEDEIKQQELIKLKEQELESFFSFDVIDGKDSMDNLHTVNTVNNENAISFQIGLGAIVIAGLITYLVFKK